MGRGHNPAAADPIVAALLATTLSRLGLPARYDWPELLSALKRVYPGTVKFVGVSSGVWKTLASYLIHTPTHSVIQYSENSPQLYREHCIMHEIGHLLIDYLLSGAERALLVDVGSAPETSDTAICRAFRRGEGFNLTELLAERIAFALGVGLIESQDRAAVVFG